MIRYDIHTHVFHPKIRSKAVQQLLDHYAITPAGDGSPEELLNRLKKAHFDKAVVHSLATTAEQVVPANDWAIHIQENYNELLAFGTIHIGFENWQVELERLQQHNIRGLKLHADFQGFHLTDQQLCNMLEYIGDQFILMLHVGDDVDPMSNPSSPQKVAELVKNFPKLKIIAAHFGGFKHWQYVCDAYKDLNVYIDTSSSLEFITQRQLEQIFKTIPREYILFGSDYPLYDPGKEVDLLQKRLNLNESECEELLTNANRLFL